MNEYLKYRCGLKGITKKNSPSEMDRVLKKCRLGDVSNRIIGQLSKGYRQRVGLADALISDPSILIFDEPTVGLDPAQIREMRELIKELRHNRTVILSSHILPEVEAVCSRIIIINKGRIAKDSSTAKLKKSFSFSKKTIDLEFIDNGNVFKDALVKNMDDVDIENVNFKNMVLTVDNNFLSGAAAREQIFDIAVDNNVKIIAMSERINSLEEIFVDIVTNEKKSDNNNFLGSKK